MPVVPATWEAEAGELLELGKQRLQLAEIVPLHSSLETEGDSVSKKKKKRNAMRCHFPPTRMAITENAENHKCW